MLEFRVFISCGDEMEGFRDIAQDVLKRLDQMYADELGINQGIVIREWDFRRDNPRIVPAGTVAARSLAIVDKSHAVVAVLGRTVPTITRDEILEVFKRRTEGIGIELFLFMNPTLRDEPHRDLLAEIKNEYGEEPMWGRYQNSLDFQGTLFTTLVVHTLRRLKLISTDRTEPRP